MQLDEIVGKYKQLGIYEERINSSEYTELVFYKREIDQWTNIFEDFLGEPVKKAGEEPTHDHLLLTATYGGVKANQTLFYKKFTDSEVIGMFWPWFDDVHATLKVVLKPGSY